MNRSSGWMWVWVDVGVGIWRFQEHDTTRTLRHPHLFHPYCQEHAWVVWVWVHPQVGVGATHTHLLPCSLTQIRSSGSNLPYYTSTCHMRSHDARARAGL